MRMMVMVLMVAGVVHAEGYGRMDQETDGTYRSAGGQRYKYDLNRPQDAIKYELDVRSQLRDEINRGYSNPVNELREEVRGQRGGGLYR